MAQECNVRAALNVIIKKSYNEENIYHICPSVRNGNSIGTEQHRQSGTESPSGGQGNAAGARLPPFRQHGILPWRDNVVQSLRLIRRQPASEPVEQGPLNGFSEDIKGFEKGVMFSPMIGTIPFVGYIFTVPNGEDVNKFVENLEKNANPKWNVCTAADETVVEAVENTVFFVMSPTKFEE